jgi:hypothetical protein
MKNSASILRAVRAFDNHYAQAVENAFDEPGKLLLLPVRLAFAAAKKNVA